MGNLKPGAGCKREGFVEIHTDTWAVNHGLLSTFVEMVFVINFFNFGCCWFATNFTGGIFLRASEHTYFNRGANIQSLHKLLEYSSSPLWKPQTIISIDITSASSLSKASSIISRTTWVSLSSGIPGCSWRFPVHFTAVSFSRPTSSPLWHCILSRFVWLFFCGDWLTDLEWRL